MALLLALLTAGCSKASPPIGVAGNGILDGAREAVSLPASEWVTVENVRVPTRLSRFYLRQCELDFAFVDDGVPWHQFDRTEAGGIDEGVISEEEEQWYHDLTYADNLEDANTEAGGPAECEDVDDYETVLAVGQRKFWNDSIADTRWNKWFVSQGTEMGHGIKCAQMACGAIAGDVIWAAWSGVNKEGTGLAVSESELAGALRAFMDGQSS